MAEKALWRIPLAGYCDVCAMPAVTLVVYVHGRTIVHEHGGRCWVGNPGPPVDGPTGFSERPFQRRTAA